MTECKTERVQFHALGSREVCGQFDGGDISSDAGGLLLREVEKRTGILKQFAGCFQDYRDPRFVEHRIEPLVAQRVYGLCLGYEDLNDHDQLRSDPVLAVMVDETDPKGRTRKQERDRGKALAGKSTLNRLELSTEGAASHPYKKIGRDEAAMDRLMVDVFLQAHRRAPRQIILDLDATDNPIHGNQEGRFFHGYYRHYCYLPLYIFCGEFLLCARLRSSDIDGAAGTVEELERIVGQIRQEWPRVQIVIRADSGFCRDEILSWCEAQHRVDYVIGLAKNKRLLRAIETPMEKAKQRFDRTGKSARVFKTFQYRTLDSWTRERRVIGKAEHLAKGANPRFIVTSLPKGQPTPKQIYEQIYCARGDMENRIKEQQHRIVCRPDQHGHHARQSTPALLLIGRVHVDASLATARIAGYRIRACAVHHDPPQVAQDRSADPRHRPPDLDSDGRRVSLCQRVCSDLREPPENPATLLNVSARTSHPFRPW